MTSAKRHDERVQMASAQWGPEASANPLRLAVFLSHPIQYHSPVLQQLARREDVKPAVYYYGSHGLGETLDRSFGVATKWDIDMLGGYEHHFLPRRWPTTDPEDCRPLALNRGIDRALSRGWDVAFMSGFGHVNNWEVAARARRASRS